MFYVVLQRQITRYVLQHFVLGLFLFLCTKLSHYHNHGTLQKPNYVLHKCTFCVLFWGTAYMHYNVHIHHIIVINQGKRGIQFPVCVCFAARQLEPKQLQSTYVRICLVVLHSTYILHIVYIELSINGKQEQGRHPGDCASSLPQGRQSYIFQDKQMGYFLSLQKFKRQKPNY